jgi:dTMP kinase
MGVSLKVLKNVNKYLLKSFKVNFTFLNTVSVKNMKIRLKKRKTLNRYDTFKKQFYSKVQKGFLKISRNKNNYMIINSNIPIEINKKEIIKKIDKLIK